MVLKIVVFVLLLLIFISLGSALVAMVRKRNDPDRMAKSLKWRVIFSFILIIVVIVSVLTGHTHFHGIQP